MFFPFTCIYMLLYVYGMLFLCIHAHVYIVYTTESCVAYTMYMYNIQRLLVHVLVSLCHPWCMCGAVEMWGMSCGQELCI